MICRQKITIKDRGQGLDTRTGDNKDLHQLDSRTDMFTKKGTSRAVVLNDRTKNKEDFREIHSDCNDLENYASFASVRIKTNYQYCSNYSVSEANPFTLQYKPLHTILESIVLVIWKRIVTTDKASLA